MIELIVMILLYYHLPIILYHGGAIMYFDAHFIFNTFRSRGVFMFVLCLMILCSVRPSFAAEAEATLQAETTDDSAIEAAGIVSEHGQLSVSSSGFVVDKNQSVFQIQGISTHNLAWYPEYVNVDTFRKLRDEFNINTIRLAMYTAEDGGYCVSDDTARQQMLACLTSGIEAAIQLDMYVIVDWHILSDSNPNLYKETALSFFERIASTYGDKPNILYEICNEPNGDTSWDEIKSYSVDVIDRIRMVPQLGVRMWILLLHLQLSAPISFIVFIFMRQPTRKIYKARCRPHSQMGFLSLYQNLALRRLPEAESLIPQALIPG